MNRIVSRGMWTVLATGGFLALGAGVAHADTATIDIQLDVGSVTTSTSASANSGSTLVDITGVVNTLVSSTGLGDALAPLGITLGSVSDATATDRTSSPTADLATDITTGVTVDTAAGASATASGDVSASASLGSTTTVDADGALAATIALPGAAVPTAANADMAAAIGGTGANADGLVSLVTAPTVDANALLGEVNSLVGSLPLVGALPSLPSLPLPAITLPVALNLGISAGLGAVPVTPAPPTTPTAPTVPTTPSSPGEPPRLPSGYQLASGSYEVLAATGFGGMAMAMVGALLLMAAGVSVLLIRRPAER